MLSESFKEIPALGRLREPARFAYLAERVPQGVLQILHRCLSDEDTRATPEELLTHKGVELFLEISESRIEIDEEPCPIDNEMEKSQMPALHYFLTCESEEKQSCAMIKMLDLMRVKTTEPVTYILSNNLVKPMISRIVQTQWDVTREPLVLSAIKFGTFMMHREPALRQEMKQQGFLKLFLEALKILACKDELYRFACTYSKGNSLSVMQLAHKHSLFQYARDKAATTDVLAQSFIKDSISYYGKIAILLIELQLRNGSPEFEVLKMVDCIPVHFKARDCEAVIKVLSKVERSLVKEKRSAEKKLEILDSILTCISEMYFYWPWLKYSFAQGLCTSHHSSHALVFCRNPLLFTCKDCRLTLCMPCASKHCHSFMSLEYCGYISDSKQCTCATVPGATCDCYTNPITSASLDFLNRVELSRPRSLLVNGTPLKQGEDNDCFRVAVGQDSPTVTVEGGEPLITQLERTKPEMTLVYYEVEVKSGGIFDSIGIGITGFAYRGDTGLVVIDGQSVGIGPTYGSYDCVGLGITPSQIYLTYNGLLLRPLYSHPTASDYRLRVELMGFETAVKLKMNGSASLFKPPFNSSIRSHCFIPEEPEDINEHFFNNIKHQVKSCQDHNRSQELTERLSNIKSKSDKILSFLLKRRKPKRKVSFKPSDPCVLF